ncbi:hypothetical protein [Streptomyces sp. SLBN-134]|uniref:hypothetical protein n=1 Tax=Streptomyces sp. SLBN-134 TaxID=2768456 RepID=UPI001153701F|nr:hypothetical protein [Streptomyces sp. SLBN-134]TQL21298.1 hypothetical protein FBY37_3278 [Streptomyces sp. SLBN-134]
MTTAPGGAPHPPPSSLHPLRTIRDIRESLPEDQRRHFDAELADTEIEALPEMLHRWVTLSNDGFEEFLLSRPFEGLEFGARSYDEQTDAK